MIVAGIDDRHSADTREMEKINPWPKDHRFSTEFPTAKDLGVSLRWVLRHAVDESKYVDFNIGILGGTPVIKGTRIPVYMILQAIEYHESLRGALKAYPQLNIDQIRDAMLFAALVLECSLDGD